MSPTRKLTPNKRLPFRLGFFVLFLSKESGSGVCRPFWRAMSRKSSAVLQNGVSMDFYQTSEGVPGSPAVALKSIFLLV